MAKHTSQRAAEVTLLDDASVFYDAREWARIRKCAVITCVRERMPRRDPAWLKVGRRILYPRNAVLSFLGSQRRTMLKNEKVIALGGYTQIGDEPKNRRSPEAGEKE